MMDLESRSKGFLQNPSSSHPLRSSLGSLSAQSLPRRSPELPSHESRNCLFAVS